MEKASFEFNVEARTYEDKLRQKPGGWEQFNLMRETARTTLRNHEADYAAHRDKRIATRAADLTKAQALRINGPKPAGGPVQRPKTADELREQAAREIERDHKSSYQKLFEEKHQSLNRFVQETLGIRGEFMKSRSGWLREHDRGR